MNYQDVAFGWAARQHWSVGMVIMAAGLLYAFQGFRVFRFVLGLSAAVLGYFFGFIGAAAFELPRGVLEISLAGAAAAFSVAQQRGCVIFVSGVTWGLLGEYVANCMDAPGHVPIVVLCVSGLFGALFAYLSLRPMKIVLTTLHGTLLMVLGFVAMSTSLVPSVGVTFRAWSEGQALVVPLLLTMLFVTGFSFQANAQRGNIIAGV